MKLIYLTAIITWMGLEGHYANFTIESFNGTSPFHIVNVTHIYKEVLNLTVNFANHTKFQNSTVILADQEKQDWNEHLQGADDSDNYTRTLRKDTGKTETVDDTLKNVVKTLVWHKASSESCLGASEPLTRISNMSRFFGDSQNKYTYEDAKAFCEENRLVLAELEGPADIRSIGNYFLNNYEKQKVTDFKYYIGANDIVTEGIYMQGNGKPLKFQYYHTSQPDDADQDEDCTAIGKESPVGPIGVFDESCSKQYHLICMYKQDSNCRPDTAEETTNVDLIKNKALTLVVKIAKRSYYISTFQDTWDNALKFCKKNNKTLFNMDKYVTELFFIKLEKWEDKFFEDAPPMPPVQYWTSGKFIGSHMNAEIFWHNEKDHSSYEQPGSTQQEFTYSGVFKWSNKKGKDPGGPHGNRRDICVSFGFEAKPGGLPYVRNTNCGLPQYFVCRTIDAKTSTPSMTTEDPELAAAGIKPFDKKSKSKKSNATEKSK